MCCNRKIFWIIAVGMSLVACLEVGPDSTDAGAQACTALGAADCQATKGCRTIDAKLLDEERMCINKSQPVGCIDVDMGCGETEVLVVDDIGRCWRFPNLCFPAGWQEFDYGDSDPNDCNKLFYPFELSWVCDTECPPKSSRTIDGCLRCPDNRLKQNVLLESARKKYGKCDADRNCVVSHAAPDCTGTCGEAVAVSMEPDFEAAVGDISRDYCSDPQFEAECGVIAMDCAETRAVCKSGQCELSVCVFDAELGQCTFP